MQLLVSVADRSDARAALAGGADVIDAKDPRHGPLGPVTPELLAGICAVVGRARPVSAALGDARDARALAARAARAARLEVAFVKVGFAGVASEARARGLAAAARAALGERTSLVLVAYADWARVSSLRPARVLDVARAAGASGVLLDTASKDTPLLTLEPPAAIRAWIETAHAACLFAAIAGGLRGGDFVTVAGLGADLVGVRGAACRGGRTGPVSGAYVAALRALVRAASRSPVPALV
jgi:(5-formylfuran-3-yl)methyl phosphate synthase